MALIQKTTISCDECSHEETSGVEVLFQAVFISFDQNGIAYAPAEHARAYHFCSTECATRFLSQVIRERFEGGKKK